MVRKMRLAFVGLGKQVGIGRFALDLPPDFKLSPTNPKLLL